MQKKNVKILLALGLSILIFAVGHIYMKNYRTALLYQKDESPSEKQQREIRQTFQQVARIWRFGDYRGELADIQACSDLSQDVEKYGESILSCNPRLLNCLLEDEKFLNHLNPSLELGFSSLKPRLESRHSRRVLSFLINVTTPWGERELRLPSLCREVPLPRRIYALDAAVKDRDKTWDSFDQKIFVDKRLVKNRDLKVWATLTDQKEVKKLVHRVVKDESPEAVARGLSSEQMARFCGLMGKQLLSSQVYNAMALHPAEIDVAKPQRIHFAPYPWSPREEEKFFYYKKNQVGSVPMDREDCSKIYTKECRKNYPHLRHTLLSPTWSGFFQTLGGFPEYLVNPYRPRANLQGSSLYFNVKSEWHNLIKRAYWDGEGFSFRHFNWRFDSPEQEENLQVGFRCMRWAAKGESL